MSFTVTPWDGSIDNGLPSALQGGAIRDPGAEPEGLITRPDQFVGLSASTDILVRDMMELLLKNYPGFAWGIQPSERGKIFNIFCLNFSGKWGYTIRYVDIMDDPRRRAIIVAGREILRRFRYPVDHYDEALVRQVPRNLRMEAIPDLSGVKGTRKNAQSEVDLAIAEGRAEIVTINGEVYAQVKK